MFITEVKWPKARTKHRCSYCGETIPKGDHYATWASFGDKIYNSKMHGECLEDLQEYGAEDGFEYTLFDNPRPNTLFLVHNKVQRDCYCGLELPFTSFGKLGSQPTLFYEVDHRFLRDFVDGFLEDSKHPTLTSTDD